MLAAHLDHSVLRFIDAYHGRPDLVAEQAGWTKIVVLVAADSGETLTLRLKEGRIADWHVGGTPHADIVVTASHEILCNILELRCGPNEPYVFGELTVRGAEADFFRLDYITTQLCPT